MMTQQLGFSVLAAPIAAMDRRALSQAWYSALHLARQSRKHEHTKSTSGFKRSFVQKPVVSPQTRGTDAQSAAPLQIHREARAARSNASPVDRRAFRSPLARKIEHLFLRPNRVATRATFTIDGRATRVHVSMQQTRSGVRLVAVCPSHARESVGRALEQARYALAARGIAIDARVTE